MAVHAERFCVLLLGALGNGWTIRDGTWNRLQRSRTRFLRMCSPKLLRRKPRRTSDPAVIVGVRLLKLRLRTRN